MCVPPCTRSIPSTRLRAAVPGGGRGLPPGAAAKLRGLRTRAVLLAVLVLAPAAPAGAQRETGRAGLGIDLLATIDGPPPPVPPAVIARDAAGRVTLRAVRVATPPRIDGRLDEAVYAAVPPMTDFVQTEPAEGLPASERTEVWILFDADNVYVVARCWRAVPSG